jgi:integrase
MEIKILPAPIPAPTPFSIIFAMFKIKNKMATVNFYLKEPNSKKETLIYLAFTVGENRFKYYTQKKILPKLWDSENQRPKKSFTGSPELKDYLTSLAGDTAKIHTHFQTLNQPFTLEQIKRKLNEKFERKPTNAPLSFFQFVESYIESVKNLRKTLTVTAYKNTVRHLKEFQKKSTRRKIDFNSIDLDFYNDFTEYLMTEKKFSVNTIGKQIKNLKVFLHEATERGLNTKLDFKSKRFKVISEDSENIYLSEEEILELYNLNLSENKRLEKVRDLFIVGCFTGLRFSDFSQIKPENIRDGCISIRTQKTDEPVKIPIHETVKEIMGKYKKEFANSLPPANSNQKMNEYLKEVGKLAVEEMLKQSKGKGDMNKGLNQGIPITTTRGGMRITATSKKYELVSTHTARRSFATNLFLQGFPSISLMKITGHLTEKAFMTYIKISPEVNANKLREFWSTQVKLRAV